MTYHSVIDYIRAGRACGLNDREISERLKRGGWLELDISDAFGLVKKMDSVHPEKQKDPALCPPDQAQVAPEPGVTDRLLSRHMPHVSATRMTMWFVVLLVAFYAGFALMR
jgi:hypothetical protein